MHTGLLFSHGKERSTDTRHDMEEPRRHDAERKPGTKGHILYDSISVKYPDEANP